LGKILRSNGDLALRALLTEAREAEGLTQEQLARKLRKPQSYVRQRPSETDSGHLSITQGSLTSKPQEGSTVADEQSTGAAADVDEAAATWLLRLEASASAELRKEFQIWLDADPRHRAAFIRLTCAWTASETFRLFRPADGRVDEDLIKKL